MHVRLWPDLHPSEAKIYLSSGYNFSSEERAAIRPFSEKQMPHTSQCGGFFDQGDPAGRSGYKRGIANAVSPPVFGALTSVYR